MAQRQPRLFLYSLLLPAASLGVGYTVKELLPGRILGATGMVLIVLLVLWPVCRHFAKSFGRQFSGSERLRFFIYLLLWALVLEALALFAYVAGQIDTGAHQSDVSGLIWVAAIAVVVDAVIMWVGVYFVAERFLAHYLKGNASSVT